jgi:hypothetical protein
VDVCFKPFVTRQAVLTSKKAESIQF